MFEGGGSNRRGTLPYLPRLVGTFLRASIKEEGMKKFICAFKA
jgi:hypothetical protein